MKPDLKSYNVTKLLFHLEVPLASKIISRIRRISPPDSEGDCLFVDSDKRYKGWAWVYGVKSHQRKKSDIIKIDFTYTQNGEKLGKDVPRIQQLVELLSSIEGQFDFECLVDFQFKKRSNARIPLNLPLKLSDSSDIPLNRIMGLHLAKTTGKEVKYDVFLDVALDGTIRISAIFTFQSALDSGLADRILGEASKISSSLVSTENKRNEPNRKT